MCTCVMQGVPSVVKKYAFKHACEHMRMCTSMHTHTHFATQGALAAKETPAGWGLAQGA